MTDKEKQKVKPPTVVILGHVDHGKTSILDYIRHSKVAEGETGGITQHTGAYQVEQGGKTITFIDTPGHEAFSAMRSRGVKVADVAVLVVAADDGIMPQTKEALAIIQKAGLPFVVAINKIDKPGTDVQKVKNQLLENNVLLEGYGGQVPNVELSAKTGQGIDELLDMINLVAELEELKMDEQGNTEAVVIESSMDPKRGPMATLIVKKGILKKNSIIAGTSVWAKVKTMEDFKGVSISEAGPSTPVVIIGLNAVPRVGEKFIEVSSIKDAEERVAKKQRKEKEGRILEPIEGQTVINIVLKADVDGTLEAVRSVLRSIENEKVGIRILDEGVGEITDSDIRLAEGGNALVVGFRVAPNQVAKNMLQQKKIKVVSFNTIYELVEGVREAMLGFLKPSVTEEVTGKIKVLKIFRSEKSRMIIGGKVIDGHVRRGAMLDVIRGDKKEGQGKLNQIKSVDKVIEEAKKGEELGMLFEGSVKIEEGDILEAVEKKREEASL
ncbi:MAG: translation initiation factor IF-2 [Candidatus Spechtbacteria bacterium]|nr:translation initiation factor IF-2 [Candidatus Spechtbacteria bacterium]